MRNKPLNDDGAMQFVRQFCLPDGAQCEGGESPCANFAYCLNPKETIPHVGLSQHIEAQGNKLKAVGGAREASVKNRTAECNKYRHPVQRYAATRLVAG
jgi:hypothetical protein